MAKICTRLKNIKRFQKGKPRWDLEKLRAERQKVQDTAGGGLGATECASGNVEVQCNSVKERVLDTVSGLLIK